MKRIKLTKGKYALVDDSDFEFLNQWKWFYRKHQKKNVGYAKRWESPDYGKRRQVSMHSYIMPKKDGHTIDHVNCDGLDNRRANLRYATPSQQQQNQGIQRTPKSSKYKGVSLSKRKKDRANPWTARIRINNKQIHLGVFKTEEAAAEAYQKAAKRLHGEFAKW